MARDVDCPECGETLALPAKFDRSKKIRCPDCDHRFLPFGDEAEEKRPKYRSAKSKSGGSPKWLPDLVSWGAGPRACQYLILGAKARAVLHGRVHATTEDIKAVALPVLRHRVMTTFHADAEGISSDAIVQKLLDAIPTPAENGKKKS